MRSADEWNKMTAPPAPGEDTIPVGTPYRQHATIEVNGDPLDVDTITIEQKPAFDPEQNASVPTHQDLINRKRKRDWIRSQRKRGAGYTTNTAAIKLFEPSQYVMDRYWGFIWPLADRTVEECQEYEVETGVYSGCNARETGRDDCPTCGHLYREETEA